MPKSEIERKFLITRLPHKLLATASPTRIRQGYLQSESARELRLRQRGEQFWITEKQGQGLQRLEQEMPLDELLFNMLWPLTKGRRLEKTRYLLPQADLTLEFDIFSGNLSPLILLEVEFVSLEASRAFTPPPYVTREVTEDPAFKNASLAIFGLPDSVEAVPTSAEAAPGKKQDERN
jgi:CYTH domain-containing protein